MNIDLTQAKHTLEQLQNELQTRVEKISDHNYNPQDDLGEHWDDQAVSYQENDMRENLKIEAQEELVQVKQALRRIENGTYGECSDCGEDIQDKRLQAVPYASKCMQHAS